MLTIICQQCIAATVAAINVISEHVMGGAQQVTHLQSVMRCGAPDNWNV